MDVETAQNGHRNGKIYVKFGPGETDEMPIEWAEKMLTEWRQKDPGRWGKLLSEIVTRGR
jgi:hypothetical protein